MDDGKELFLKGLDKAEPTDKEKIYKQIYGNVIDYPDDPELEQKALARLMFRQGWESIVDDYHKWKKDYDEKHDFRLTPEQLEEVSKPHIKQPEGISFEPFVPLKREKERKLFNPDDLPEPLRKQVIEVAESYQVPVDLPANMALGAVSTAVQGKFFIEIKPDWTEPVNLYLATIAKPSERKSPVMKEMFNPVNVYEQNVNESLKDKVDSYHQKKEILERRIETTVKRLADLKVPTSTQFSKTTDEKTSNPETYEDYLDQQLQQTTNDLNNLEKIDFIQLTVDDCTPERLAALMQDNDEKMTIASTEGGGLFGMMAGRYNRNVNIDIYLKPYSRDMVKVDRVNGDPIVMYRPLLTVCVAVQPEVIKDIVPNSTFRGRGLISRFLYSWPVSRIGERAFETEPVKPETRSNYSNLIRHLLSVPDIEDYPDKIIRLEDDARELFQAFCEQVEGRYKTDLSEIDDWTGKICGNTGRIAALLHIVQYGAEAATHLLSVDTMVKAVDLGYYYISHALVALAEDNGEQAQDIQDAETILKGIQENQYNTGGKRKLDLKNPVTTRDIMRVCRSFGTVEGMKPGLEVLSEHGYIHIERVKANNGKPCDKVYFNPEYVDQAFSE